jgi:hypothetical protein
MNMLPPPSYPYFFFRGGGKAKYAPPLLTPDLAGEGAAFPIYLILKVKQDEHDTELAKKPLETNQNKQKSYCLKNIKAIKNK